ncbi:MAG: hypothetical protein AB4050_02730 [Synechococcus sp.]
MLVLQCEFDRASLLQHGPNSGIRNIELLQGYRVGRRSAGRDR